MMRWIFRLQMQSIKQYERENEMADVALLDCTLRDGGYINQWQFGKRAIHGVCENLINANMDIVEVGFFTDQPHTPEHSLYSGESELVRILPLKKKDTMYAAMIAIGEKEMDPISLPPKSESILDIVRITFHNTPDEMEKMVRFSRCLMEKGYKVCVQPVGTTAYSDKELIELVEKVNQLNPYAFYLVDTLGKLYRQGLMRRLYLIDHNLTAGIKIGFHSHNNLQMSFSLAQQICEFQSARQFIIDCSVFGMGRGAGNLCTESIAKFLNEAYGGKYDILPMLEIIDEYLMSFYAQNQWGYSAAYFLSAVKNCHPNYSSYLLSRQTLQAGEISKLLSQIPFEEREIFNKKLIDRLYLDYQSNVVDDREVREQVKAELAEKEVLIIAPGRSVDRERTKISDYIARHEPYVISVNFVPKLPVDMVFVSNQRRYAAMTSEEHAFEKLLVTSNIHAEDKTTRTLNYASLLNDDDYHYDNAGLMLIELLQQLGVTKTVLAGFDGFVADRTQNYYDKNQLGIADTEHLMQLNRSMETQLQKFSRVMDFVILTQTRYKI